MLTPPDPRHWSHPVTSGSRAAPVVLDAVTAAWRARTARVSHRGRHSTHGWVLPFLIFKFYLIQFKYPLNFKNSCKFV
jgi:hypothetical protein